MSGLGSGSRCDSFIPSNLHTYVLGNWRYLQGQQSGSPFLGGCCLLTIFLLLRLLLLFILCVSPHSVHWPWQWWPPLFAFCLLAGKVTDVKDEQSHFFSFHRKMTLPHTRLNNSFPFLSFHHPLQETLPHSSKRNSNGWDDESGHRTGLTAITMTAATALFWLHWHHLDALLAPMLLRISQ